jgi:hypothetical protein
VQATPWKFNSGGEIEGGLGVSVLSVGSDMTFDGVYGANSGSSQGSIVLAGTTSALDASSFDNSGTIGGAGGVDFGSLSNSGNITDITLFADGLDNTGQISVPVLNVFGTLTNGSSITVAGTLGAEIGNLVNSGTMQVAAALIATDWSNTGAFTFSGSPDTNNDVGVSGTADLGGSITINGFVTAGTTFLSVFQGHVVTIEAGTTVQAAVGRLSPPRRVSTERSRAVPE